MTGYIMTRICVPRKVRSSTKLRGVRRSPELFARSTDSHIKNSSLSSPEYLWQGKISVCKVLVPIKVVPVKNDYFLHPKFELHRYQQRDEFLYLRSFY